MEEQRTFPGYVEVILGVLILIGLYLVTLYSYLLFHNIAEIFSVVVAFSIFILVWNSRRFLDNDYFLLIGIGYLFIGGLLLLHTFAYEGMNIFAGYGSNLAIQLWICSRYIIGITFLIAPLLIGRKLKDQQLLLIIFGYAAVTSLLLASIFYWDIFPDCYIEGSGLTPFKKISEGVVSLTLLGSIYLLHRKRSEFDPAVFYLIVASLILTIGVEMTFAFYRHLYSSLSLIGHYLNLISYYLIYKAVIVTSLMKPYSLLFRNLKLSEQEFKKSMNYVQTIIDNIGDPTLVIDTANYRIRSANKAARERIGGEYADGSLLCYQALHQRDSPCTEPEKPCPLRKVVATMGPVRITHIDHEDDNEIFTDIVASPIFDRNGEVVQMIESLRDITEIKQTEESLQLFKHLINQSNDGILVIDPVTGGFLDVNDQACRNLGYIRQELLGMKHTDITAEMPDDYSFENRVKQLREKGEMFSKELYRRKDTTFFPVEASLRLITHENKDYLVCVARDVTTRKRVEDELKESEEKYRNLVERANDGITIIQDGVLKYANPHLAEMIGYTVEELTGTPFIDHIHPDEVSIVLDRYKRRMAGEDVVQVYETIVKHKDGTDVDVEFNAGMITYEGKTSDLVFVRDITERKLVQRILETQKEFAADLVKYSTVPTFVIDPHHKIQHWNNACEEITGISASEIIGTDRFYRSERPSLADIVVSRELNEVPKSNKEYASSRFVPNGIHAENWVPDLGGKKRYVLFDAAPIYNTEGELVAALETLQDVTEQKQAEQLIIHKLEIEHVIAAVSSMFVAPTDIDGAIEASLEEVGRLCGASRSYVFLLRNDGTVIDNTHEWCAEGVEPLKENLQNFHTDMYPWWMAKLYNDETIHVTDISSLPPEASVEKELLEMQDIRSLIALPLYLGGEVAGFIGMDNVVNTREWGEDDITVLRMVSNVIGMAIERGRSEKEVSGLKRQMEFILGATKTGLDIIDSEFNIRYIDLEWEKVYGDPTGRKCYEYFMDRNEMCPGCGIPKALETKETTVTEEVLVKESNRPIQVTTLPFQNEDGEWLVAEVNADITERKQAEDKLREYAEELQRSNELKDLFTDIMHHDLLNPAGIVRGYTDVLLDMEEDGKKRRSLQAIERSNEKLIKIIERASRFAKLQAIEELEFEKMDIGVIFKEVIENLRPILDEKAMMLEFAADGKYPANVNPVIEEVFANLLSNAIKYSPKESRIIVDILDAGNEWKVTVTDFGEGISDEDKSRLFERFRRVDKGEVKGTGLGLAIVKKLIALHGGSVGVKDNPAGKGSVFWVTLKKA